MSRAGKHEWDLYSEVLKGRPRFPSCLRDCQRDFCLSLATLKGDQMKKSVEKFAGGKHKKVEQALGLSLRNLFEQLAWRTSPAAVRAYNISNSCVTP